MTQLTVQTISFETIIEYASNKQKSNTSRFSIISCESSYRGYYEPNEQAVILNFTLFGDYVGSTVEKSNYYVLQESIKQLYYDNYSSQEDYENDNIFSINENYHRYSGGYSSNAIAITGDLPLLDWQVILEAITEVENYPLLDETHHTEEIQSEDCWESWTSWQYEDITSVIEDRGINLDSEKFHAIYEQANCDRYSWLWNVLHNFDAIPKSENVGRVLSEKIPTQKPPVEITEVNATAYYNFDPDDSELISQLVEHINTH